jgi:hypothetical protein
MRLLSAVSARQGTLSLVLVCLLLGGSFIGCAPLHTKENDGMGSAIGEVVGRFFLGVITLGASEILEWFDYEEKKKTEEASVPSTSGYLRYRPVKPPTVIVWGTDLGAIAGTINTLQKMGFRIVERAQVDRLFEEQRFRLMYTPDREADLLKIGQMLGADQVVFVEVTAYVPYPAVALRGVSVENSEIIWSGLARSRIYLEDFNTAAMILPSWAIGRAWCPQGTWNDRTGCGRSGTAR